MNKLTSFLLLFAVWWSGLSGCSKISGKNSSFDKPNIVFLISDDQSAVDLGVYGNQYIQTPNLDQLASEGMLFNRAYATSPSCSPSRTSILTGMFPADAQASRLHAKAPQKNPNLIKLLNQQGYYTGAYRKVHQPSVKDDFDFYGDGDESFESFFDQLSGNQPFFLLFGSHDPHRPYHPDQIENNYGPEDVAVPDYLPDTPKVRRDLANYYDKIARFDRESGKLLNLLKERGLDDNTMVVMTSDQGMPFPRAKGTLYEAGLRVPLIIRWPGVVSSGVRSGAMVSLIDLTSTWLEAAGINAPESMSQSHSLLPILTGEQDRIRTYVYAERDWHDNWDPMRTIIGKRYKLIQRYRPGFPYTPTLDIQNSPTYMEIQRLQVQDRLKGVMSWYSRYSDSARSVVELYDLENDEGEWNNLALDSSYQDRLLHLQLELGKWMDEIHDFLPPPKTAFPGGPESDYNKYIDPLDSDSV